MIENPATRFSIQMLSTVAGFFIYISCLQLQAGNENYPAGARSAALSATSVTLCDTWSTFNNQAGLAFIEAPIAGLHFENKFLVKEYAMQAGSVAIPFKPGAIGVSYRFFGYSKYYEAKFGLAYARRFTNYFSVGIQIDYFQTHIAEGFGNYNAVTAEIALLAKPFKNVKVGAHFFNPAKVKYNAPAEEKIPVVIRIGIDYSFEEKASLFFETEKNIVLKQDYKGGLEVKTIGDLYFRGGFSSGYEQYSFGLGYTYKKIIADLAFTKHFYLGFTPHVSISFQF